MNSNLPPDHISDPEYTEDYLKNRDDLLNYAIKEGYLDETDVDSWSEEVKDEYYEKSLEWDYDPEED